MKKVIILILSFFIGAFLFSTIVQFVGWSKIKLALLRITVMDCLIIFCCTVLIMIAATLRWKTILRDQGYNVSFFTLFRFYCFDHSLNFLVPIVPFAGEIFRAYFLNEKHNLPLKITTSSTLIDSILEITSHLIIALVGVIYFIFRIGFPPKKIATILFGGFFFCLFLLCTFYFKSFKKESFFSFFIKKLKYDGVFEIEKELFIFFNLKNKNFWKSLLLAFLRDGTSLLRTFFLLLFLRQRVNFFSAFSIFSFSILAQLFPIPAFLGSHEAIQFFVFRSLALGTDTATAFTLIIRSVDFFLAILGILAVSNIGIKAFIKTFLK